METKLSSVRTRDNGAAWPRTSVLAVLMAGWIAAVWTGRGACQPVVNGLMTTTVDVPLRYEAEGVVNTSSAFAGAAAGAPAISGPWYGVPGLAPPPPGGAHWEFSVRHTATNFIAGQATGASLRVKGRTHPRAGRWAQRRPQQSA